MTGALSAVDEHPLSKRHLVEPPAQGHETQEAVVVDVLDHEPDLVHVGGDHDGRSGTGPGADHVAHAVGGHLVHQGLEFGGEKGSDRPFVAGHSVRVGEEGEEAQDLFHAVSFL